MPASGTLFRSLYRHLDDLQLDNGVDRKNTTYRVPGDIVAWKFLFWTFMLQVVEDDEETYLYYCKTMKGRRLPWGFDGKELQLLDARDIVMLKTKR